MRRTGRRPLAALAATLATIGLVGVGIVATEPARADHHQHDPGDGNGKQFVWPMSSYVSANDYYFDGNEHTGSADLASQLYTPIRPARPGKVVDVGFDGLWYVLLEHERLDGFTYRTYYGHLAERPEVTAGERVGLNRVIGYNGRSGKADGSGAHIHFRIFRYFNEDRKEVMRIPDLKISDWVEYGDHIPGDYDQLEPIDQPTGTFDVRVTEPDGLGVYDTTDRKADDRFHTLEAGDVVTVLESQNGQYRVEVDGQLGWIPYSGVVPVDSTVSPVRVTAVVEGWAIVRRQPGSDQEKIGIVADDTYLLSYEEAQVDDGEPWRRVLWWCNDSDQDRPHTNADDSNAHALGGCAGTYGWRYGWMGPSVVQPTSEFDTRIRIDNLRVFGNKVVDGEDQPDCPCNSGTSIGRLGNLPSLVHAVQTRNGWYQIDDERFDGGWIRGWWTDTVR